jgi:hypothetical protein
MVTSKLCQTTAVATTRKPLAIDLFDTMNLFHIESQSFKCLAAFFCGIYVHISRTVASFASFQPDKFWQC